MDHFDHSGAAGMPEVRLEPADPGIRQGGPAGEAASGPEDARAKRRAARLARLDRAGQKTEQAIDRLVEYMHGQLPEPLAQPFARIVDPTLALTRLTRSLRQISALEDKLDQDDEERATRREAEAREQAKREEEASQTKTAESPELERRKSGIRHAMRNLLFDADMGLNHTRRERLLDDLFSDYEVYDPAYAADSARIMLDLCREAEIDPAPGPDGEEDSAVDDEDAPVIRDEAQAPAVIWRYLAAVAPDLCPAVDDEPDSRVRGPP